MLLSESSWQGVRACYFIGVFLSTIAQLVEHMTVNHDVTGSRPVGGVQ